MKTVILCGGLGSRLREETELRPKPMVTIGGKPILWHIMKIYASQGFKDFVLALGYKGHMIREYFNSYELMNSDITIELGNPNNIVVHQSHQDRGWKISLVDTGENSLKGTRLKRLQPYIQEDNFMVTYGDGVSNINIPALLKFHKQHGKTATITGIQPTSQFGNLSVRNNQIMNFNEKPKTNSWISGGFFVFNKSIFDYFSDGEECDLEYAVLKQLAQEKQIKIYKHGGFWACMDTFRDMEILNKLWDKGEAKWKIW